MKAFLALSTLALFALVCAAPVHAVPSTPASFDKDIVCQSGSYQLIGELKLSRHPDSTEVFRGTFTDNFGVRHPAKLNATASPTNEPAVLTLSTSLGRFVFNISAATLYTDWSDSINVDAPRSFAFAPAMTLDARDHNPITRAWTISFSQWLGTPMVFEAAVSGRLTVSSDADGNILGGELALPIGPHDSNVVVPVYAGFVSAQRLSTVVKIKGRNFVLNGASATSDYNFTQCMAIYGNSKSSIYLLWSALIPET